MEQKEAEYQEFKKKYEEVLSVNKDVESIVNQKVESFKQELVTKREEVEHLRQLLDEKDKVIRTISVAHTHYKQKLESIKEELMYYQNEKENLSKKLTTMEKGDSKSAFSVNKSLTDQNKKLLGTIMTLLNSTRASKKKNLSNSVKNSTVLLSKARRLSAPSPSKKRKSSKRKIKKLEFSAGSKKSKLLKRGRNIVPNETAPFPMMFQQFTPLMSTSKDKNLQMYTQKFRTEKHDLLEANAKIQALQKYINKLKQENTKAKEKYRKMRSVIQNFNLGNFR